MRNVVRTILLVLALIVGAPANAKGEMAFRYLDAKMQSCAAGSTGCRIYAQGIITEATPREFSNFLAAVGIDKTSTDATIALASEGGDVAGAMALGRLIRARGFETELIMTKGPRRICPGDPDFDDVKSPRLKPPGCAQLHWERLPAGCLSACIFAFVGGVERHMGHKEQGIEDFTVSRYGYGRRPMGQAQIGFHPIRPGINPEGGESVRGYLMDMGAVWGQREMARATDYFDSMGIGRGVLAFFTRQRSGVASGDFYFPTIAELEEVGILENADFTGPRLDVVTSGARIGLVVSWLHVARGGDKTQIGLFCSSRMGGGRTIYIAFSRQPGSDSGTMSRTPIALDAMQYPPPPQVFSDGHFFNAKGMTVGWQSWSLVLQNDRGTRVERGQRMALRPEDLRSEPAPVSIRPPVATGNVFYTRDTSGAGAEHYVAELDPGFDTLLAGNRLTIGYDVFNAINVDTDEDFRTKLRAVRQNCLR